MAYKSKYYNPAKAHEYYEKHKQLKGRKKKTSIADLSEDGKIAAKEVKAQLQAELKAALKKVKKGNTAERKRLRELYQKKYEAELEEIRKDSAMVKAPKQKKEKAAKVPKAAKAKAPKATKETKQSSNGKASNEFKATPIQKATAVVKEEPKTEAQKILDTISRLKNKMADMDDRKKAAAKEIIEKLIEQYKKKLLDEVE